MYNINLIPEDNMTIKRHLTLGRQRQVPQRRHPFDQFFP